jgi:hypothetical protein
MPRDPLARLHRLRLYAVEVAKRELAIARAAETEAEAAVTAIAEEAARDREARRGSLHIEPAVPYRAHLALKYATASARLANTQSAADRARGALTAARTEAEIAGTLRQERALADERKRRDD